MRRTEGRKEEETRITVQTERKKGKEHARNEKKKKRERDEEERKKRWASVR